MRSKTAVEILPALTVGEMYVEAENNNVLQPPKFELHQAVVVTDHIRDLLLEAGYDCEALFI